MAKIYFNYFDADHLFAQPIINRLSESGHQIIMESISIDSNSDIDASIIYLSQESESNPGIQDAITASDFLKDLDGNSHFKIIYLVHGKITISVEISQANIINVDNLTLDSVIELINNRLKSISGTSDSSSKETNNFKMQHVIIAKSVNIRRDPDPSATVMESLKQGQVVDVIEQTNADWYKINLSGTPGNGYVAQRYLKPVSEIQELLKKTVAPNIQTDGVFGPTTGGAVKAFQRRYDLEETGKVDEQTFQRLEEIARMAENEPLQESTASTVPAKWILKLNPGNWELDTIKPGMKAWFHSHDLKSQKRGEYELFAQVKPGDLMLGFAFEPVNEIVCLFWVEEGLHDTNLGEGIRFLVEIVFEPRLTRATLEQVLGETSSLSVKSPIRLISITQEQYDTVLKTASVKPAVDTALQNIYYSKSRFSIRDGSEPVLGVPEIAKEVAELIRNLKTKEYGRMVGIFGNWGRGKTFMVEQVWKALEAEKTNPFIRINFHAWKYQDTHASWAYLYEAFAKKYFSKDKTKNGVQNFFSDFSRRFNLNILRHGFWPLIRIGISAGAVVLFAWLAMQEKEIQQLERAFWYLLTTAGIADSVRLVVRFFREHKIKEKATEVFNVYFEKPSFKDLLGVQSEIQNELRNLLKCWIKEQNGEPEKQILLVVDDIDRCSEDRIVQIIDALRVMLEDEEISKRVIIIAAIDERVLRRAIKWKYKELLDADRELNPDANTLSDKWILATRQITSEYMDKLFLAGIKLGTLTADERIEVYEKFLHEENPDTSVKADTPPETKANKTDAEKMYKSFRDMADIPNKEEPDTTENKEPAKNTATQNPQPAPAEKPAENHTAGKPTLTTETGFELNNQEDAILRSYVQQLYDATPRQIRIFYYRFILARNLLSISLVQRESIIQFQDNTRITLLAHLLMHYTQLRSNEQLISDRELLLSRNGDAANSSIQGIINGHEPELVSEILEALEMVIAY